MGDLTFGDSTSQRRPRALVYDDEICMLDSLNVLNRLGRLRDVLDLLEDDVGLTPTNFAER